MPRIARNFLETKFYHIMVQGINKEYIFKDEEHINSYKNIILNKLKDSQITILSYCIMTNHAHFLIYCEKNDELSKFMQRINTTYSHFFNKKNKRVGYVFRDRFRSQPILNQKQLYTCMHYIHHNPVKAKMVNKMSDYPYSSYNEFFGRKEIISYESIKILFNNTNNYIDKFKSIHNISYTDSFIDLKETSIDEFIKEFKTNNHIEQIQDLKNNSIKLNKFVLQAREYTDIKIVELAKLLGISKSTVGNIIKNK